MGELLDKVVTQENMKAALDCLNLSSCSGVDRQRPRGFVSKFPYEKEWIRQQILNGTYKPVPLLRVYIPKKGKENQYRMLGIPAVRDRMIQFAIARVIAPMYEIDFSPFSYGFIHGRSCYDALAHVLWLANQGKNFAVSIDLKQFFDTVPHKVLMDILQEKIQDKELLDLIHKYLITGVVETDVFGKRHKSDITCGVPQGGPLSPILGNVILDKLDKFLQQNRIQFSRYADDCLIMTGGAIEALDVFDKVSKYIEDTLHLEINYTKSYLRDITETDYLGFTFREESIGYTYDVADKKWISLKERMLDVIVNYYNKVHPKTFAMKMMELTRGWINYYGLADIQHKLEEVDMWFKEQIMSINKYKQDVSKREQMELMLSGINYHEAVGLANKSAYINHDVVVPVGVSLQDQYQWIIKAGYKTCVQIYEDRVKKYETYNKVQS